MAGEECKGVAGEGCKGVAGEGCEGVGVARGLQCVTRVVVSCAASSHGSSSTLQDSHLIALA